MIIPNITLFLCSTAFSVLPIYDCVSLTQRIRQHSQYTLYKPSLSYTLSLLSNGVASLLILFLNTIPFTQLNNNNFSHLLNAILAIVFALHYIYIFKICISSTESLEYLSTLSPSSSTAILGLSSNSNNNYNNNNDNINKSSFSWRLRNSILSAKSPAFFDQVYQKGVPDQTKSTIVQSPISNSHYIFEYDDPHEFQFPNLNKTNTASNSLLSSPFLSVQDNVPPVLAALLALSPIPSVSALPINGTSGDATTLLTDGYLGQLIIVSLALLVMSRFAMCLSFIKQPQFYKGSKMLGKSILETIILMVALISSNIFTTKVDFILLPALGNPHIVHNILILLMIILDIVFVVSSYLILYYPSGEHQNSRYKVWGRSSSLAQVV